MALIAAERAAALVDLLDPAEGTPSADTFRRVFEVLHPEAFAACLAAWTASLRAAVAGEVVAFDGKTPRGTLGRGRARPLHTLHAWATGQRLLLHQATVGGAPEEVGGIVDLLGALAPLAGAVVTTDANGCARAVAQATRDASAAYLLALKRNRVALDTAVAAAFARTPPRDDALTVDRGDGRVERRRVWTLPASALGAAARALPDLRTRVRVHRTRVSADGTSTEEAVYVTSLAASAAVLGAALRAHGGIENQLHHVLDVVFGEDRSRVRDTTAAANLGGVRRIALTLLRQGAAKLSLAMKTRKATLSVSYMRHLLTLGIN